MLGAVDDDLTNLQVGEPFRFYTPAGNRVEDKPDGELHKTYNN